MGALACIHGAFIDFHCMEFALDRIDFHSMDLDFVLTSIAYSTQYCTFHDH